MEFAIRKADLDKNYLPWEINKEGPYGALVIRYWGCSLSCAVCYSQSYAYLNETGSRKKVEFSVEECDESIRNLSKRVGWTRIQGGEPLLNYERAIFTTKLCGISLKYMETNSPYDNSRVVIQTNGLWLGKEDEDKLNNFFEELLNQILDSSKGRIIIELSFKGSNTEATNLYADTQKRYSDVFNIQKEAFFRLEKIFEESIWKRTHRIAFYPVGGFGPQFNNPGFIPIIKKDKSEYPLFHPDTWDDDFRKVVENFRKILTERREIYTDFLQRHDFNIPLECLEPSFFQKGWTTQIIKREILRNFLLDNFRINTTPQLNIFNNELAQIPIPKASSELLSKIDDLKEYFYEAEPANHYPYL